jgi:transcriptional regulator with XRE-family HTH domain
MQSKLHLMFVRWTFHDASAATTLSLGNTEPSSSVGGPLGSGRPGPEKEPGVPGHGSPTVGQRRLAAELRRLRERAGFLGEEAAARLGWSASKLSRIETSKVGVKQNDLRLLLDLYGVSEGQLAEVLALAREPDMAASVDDAAIATLQAGYGASVCAEARGDQALGLGLGLGAPAGPRVAADRELRPRGHARVVTRFYLPPA